MLPLPTPIKLSDITKRCANHFVGIFLLLWLISFTASYGKISLPKIFADHMVLQQKTKVTIWGWASPGEKIIITFQNQKRKVATSPSGHWKIVLDPLSPGGPYQMKISGDHLIQLSDIWVGEVWLCAGQSNMEWNLSKTENASKEILSARYPMIRQFKINGKMKGKQADSLETGEWTICSPETAGSFSGVGYYFAKQIAQNLQVPVGIINASWGGTYLEAWLSHQALSKSKDYVNVPELNDADLVKWFESVEQLYLTYSTGLGVTLKEGYNVDDSQWHGENFDDDKWIDSSLPNDFDLNGLPRFDGTAWFRSDVDLSEYELKEGISLHLGRIDDEDETFMNGTTVGKSLGSDLCRSYRVLPAGLKIGKNSIAIKITDAWERGGFIDPPDSIFIQTHDRRIFLKDLKWKMNISSVVRLYIRSPNVHPNLLFNGMIHPIIPYAIKGALWYQGESNADYGFQYRKQLPLLIQDWRTRWNQENFPFYFVQLPNYKITSTHEQKDALAWPDIRESMQSVLTLPNTGMAVTVDIGDSTNIHPSNKEDVGNRLAYLALNRTYLIPKVDTGPQHQNIEFKDGKVFIPFDANSKLIVRDRYGYLKGFEVAGNDHKFHYAQANLIGNCIVVSSLHVKNPQAVRYAWSTNPDGNLFNDSGLPAWPFRSDQWTLPTQEKKFDTWIGKTYRSSYQQ